MKIIYDVKSCEKYLTGVLNLHKQRVRIQIGKCITHLVYMAIFVIFFYTSFYVNVAGFSLLLKVMACSCVIMQSFDFVKACREISFSKHKLEWDIARTLSTSYHILKKDGAEFTIEVKEYKENLANVYATVKTDEGEVSKTLGQVKVKRIDDGSIDEETLNLNEEIYYLPVENLVL